MGGMTMVTIQCSKNPNHFQSIAEVRGDVNAFVKGFIAIQDKCHICNNKLEVIF
jgi:hypothetical protein